jgi:PiT family inorganic phosphate transporter
MEAAAVGLVVLAAGFALANGYNDGGALIANGLKVPALRPLTAIALLGVAVALGPVLVGTQVAQTLAQDLITYDRAVLVLGVTVAVVTAVAVVVALTWIGLPTSLTLALVGAIAGAAVGLSQPVPWATVGRVLLIGLAAPIVGALVGYTLMRAATALPLPALTSRRIGGAHVVGFGLQAVAYAANDGQKMFAVLLVGGAAQGGLPPAQLALVAACFALGAVFGLPRAAGTITSDVLAVRPPQAVSAEVAAATAVLGSAAAGAPVSMTQSTTGGLVGAGLSESLYKVRWRVAGRLALAWVFTLPLSFAAAALAALAVTALS